jgi:hypothetical protein
MPLCYLNAYHGKPRVRQKQQVLKGVQKAWYLFYRRRRGPNVTASGYRKEEKNIN